jgi:hypothetical protein
MLTVEKHTELWWCEVEKVNITLTISGIEIE